MEELFIITLYNLFIGRNEKEKKKQLLCIFTKITVYIWHEQIWKFNKYKLSYWEKKKI